MALNVPYAAVEFQFAPTALQATSTARVRTSVPPGAMFAPETLTTCPGGLKGVVPAVDPVLAERLALLIVNPAGTVSVAAVIAPPTELFVKVAVTVFPVAPAEKAAGFTTRP